MMSNGDRNGYRKEHLFYSTGMSGTEVLTHFSGYVCNDTAITSVRRQRKLGPEDPSKHAKHTKKMVVQSQKTTSKHCIKSNSARQEKIKRRCVESAAALSDASLTQCHHGRSLDLQAGKPAHQSRSPPSCKPGTNHHSIASARPPTVYSRPAPIAKSQLQPQPERQHPHRSLTHPSPGCP